MKNVLLTLLFISSIHLAYSQEGKIKTTVIDTEIFCDHCAECESCDQNIFLRVSENTKGVRKVKIDSETNTITVTYNSKKSSLEDIEKAIALSGYKANDVEPTEEAYNSLDGCCKK
ncbi:heavy-metal-associated domain-containing protein [Brumimicrobium mesophilum]|uniref:heavy-metal-associated domain-containing protein n=1 Tax=Brumimicrobium mesophilum TaxID=392717 RepID=UPI000D140AD9|nr:heavy metal-associated domain-containing protein [Brumimicrobium mesophilum]